MSVRVRVRVRGERLRVRARVKPMRPMTTKSCPTLATAIAAAQGCLSTSQRPRFVRPFSIQEWRQLRTAADGRHLRTAAVKDGRWKAAVKDGGS